MWQNTLASWRKRIRRFGENVFDNLEKTCSVILAKTFSAIFSDNALAFWRNRSVILEKNGSAITLEIWRNVVGAVMAILYGVRYEVA